MLLCSLSNFDAYFVTRLHKAPKPFVFALKSTDNLSFFENTADYLHVFSCSPKDGEKWVENILLARVCASFMRPMHNLTKPFFSRTFYIKNEMFSLTPNPPVAMLLAAPGDSLAPGRGKPPLPAPLRLCLACLPTMSSNPDLFFVSNVQEHLFLSMFFILHSIYIPYQCCLL